MAYLNCFGNLTKSDAVGTREIKSKIGDGKSSILREKALFTSKLEVNARKQLVKGYIWRIPLYGAENWILRKVGRKFLDLSAIVCYETHKKDRIASVPISVFDTESLSDQYVRVRLYIKLNIYLIHITTVSSLSKCMKC